VATYQLFAIHRLAERAGWDREILAIELQALVDLQFEVELTGFETAEVDLILDEASLATTRRLSQSSASRKRRDS